MKRVEEIYKRFRFLLIGIPFLVLLLPFLGRGWAPQFWNAAVLLLQCPFVAIGNSVREDESVSGLFTISLVVVLFIYVDQFSRLTYGHREAVWSCLGLFVLMIAIEIFAIEVLGWIMSRNSQKSD